MISFTRPLGETLFAWNMQFNEDAPEIKGDLHIKARGTTSLMQKEVRSQRLMTFLQVASNQNLAPFVRWHLYYLRLQKSLDIEPEKLINDPEKAAIFAKIMGMANGNQQTEKAIINSPQWLYGGTPAGAIQTTLQALVVETSEQEVFRKQGSGFSAGNTETEGTT